MTTWFISRHAGAKKWIEEESGFKIDKKEVHFNPSVVQKNDKVVGSLPIHLVAEVCAKGAKYYHLTLELKRGERGKELTIDEMREANARLEPYFIEKIEHNVS
jgi:CRISPR-associated protein Csx16